MASSSVSTKVEYVPVLFMGVLMKMLSLPHCQLVHYQGCGLNVLRNFFTFMTVCNTLIVTRQTLHVSCVLLADLYKTCAISGVYYLIFSLCVLPPNIILRQLRGDVH